MKKRFALGIGVIVALAIAGIIIFSAYRSSESYRKKKAAETYKMTGTVLEITNGTMVVEPLEGEDELSSSDKFVVSMEHMNASPEPKVGDIIEVTYNGDIEESYPARALASILSVISAEEVTTSVPSGVVDLIITSNSSFN